MRETLKSKPNFQAVSNRSIELEQIEILYRRKEDLFNYFFENLNRYIKTVFRITKGHFTELVIYP